jgi:ribosome recycling factor
MISEFRSQSNIAIDQLKEDLRTVRTGRAHPSLVDGVQIDAYGGSTKMRLKELSTITTEGPTTIIIVPFDPGTIPDIEKGILASPLGLTPKNQGSRILITIPPMNEEQREKMIKLVGQMVEDKKEYIRKKRDEARKKIKHAADAKEMGEDERYRLEKDLDTETHDLMDEISKIKDHKEKEIREV